MEQEKRVLKLWHEAFNDLSSIDKFKLFIRASSCPDPKQHRDQQSGEWKAKHATLHALDPDVEPKEKVVDAKMPKFSKYKYCSIGKAVVEGCHNENMNMNEKQSVLKMLIGKMTDKTSRTTVGVSRGKLIDFKKNGVKKTGGVTKQSEKKRRVVNISDDDLKETLGTMSSESCRFLADKTKLKTVASHNKYSAVPPDPRNPKTRKKTWNINHYNGI